MQVDEQQELDELRGRVRAVRRATSAPLLVFGLATLVLAGYQGAVNYSFVPGPLEWPLCSLLALLILWIVDRVRRGRTGVGEGRLSYGRVGIVLAVVVIAGNVVWLLPFARMLLWPTTVLPLMALRQGNRRLAALSGVVGVLMIAGWVVDLLALDEFHQPLIMGGGGLALVVCGLAERVRERSIA
jgi:hypothetical protein